MKQLNNSPIAIVGLGCRLPNDIHDEHSFWDFIANGKDAIVDVPEDRWNVNKFYDPDPNKPGKMYVKKGGFLNRKIDQFDALFFGITPREAATMDPQQRLLLEVTWEALENAGIVPESLTGSSTGVFMGAFTLDNLLQQMGALSRDLIGAHSAIGSTMTIVSNRISYALDLRGPSVSMDTACSSSMVALHYACQAIWNGECNLSIAGGANIIFRPEYLVAMCKGKFLAKDGHCKSFDERADGYARGEGAGIVILKPLEEAEKDGDIIHGVIRATGVNQDGRTNGITIPNKESQVALINEVYAKAGVTAEDISYLEAHGTGTQAGDTTETNALGEALGQKRSNGNPLVVGSLKANIGHLEAASGVSSLIKTVLCLKNNAIPPVANLQKLNPNIPFDDLGIHIPRELETLKSNQLRPLAGVNSFGYGGTNAHALLEAAPVKSESNTLDEAPYLFTISAKDKQALIDLAGRYLFKIENEVDLNIKDLCFSASTRRGHYIHRLGIYADSREKLVEQLHAFIETQAGDSLNYHQVQGENAGPVFVYTGMGPQWWAMGRELFNTNKVFREEAERCDHAFTNVAGWSILDELLKDEEESEVGKTVIAQPANFLVQAALTAMWKSLGIEPAAIVGHSVGEVTAAYASGVLSLEEAAMVSFYRSQIQNKAAGLGGMLAVGLSEKEVKDILDSYKNEKVDIAAINGPSSVTLSGDSDILKSIAEDLEKEGIFNRELTVEVAYHSPYMDPLMPEMEAALASIKPKQPSIPVYSTVTGKQALGDDEVETFGAKYWCQNARQAVLFAPAMSEILKDEYQLFLEVGPHPVLSTSIKQCAQKENKDIQLVTSMRRKSDELATQNLASTFLYSYGCNLNWEKIYENGGEYIHLPSYPWQYQSYWQESPQSLRDRLESPKHPLLGFRQDLPNIVWEGKVKAQNLNFINDHCVEDLVILPGAAYVELALAAHSELMGMSSYILEDLSFEQAMIIDELSDPKIRIAIDKEKREFNIHSQAKEGESWVGHAFGRFSSLEVPTVEAKPLNSLLEDYQWRKITKDQHYNNMTNKGLQYGEAFQGIKHVWQGKEQVIAELQLSENIEAECAEYKLHPALLDACFQSLLALIDENDSRAFIPTTIAQIHFHQTPVGNIYCHGTCDSLTQESLVGDLVLRDSEGNVFVELFGIEAKALSQTSKVEVENIDDCLFDFQWITDSHSEENMSYIGNNKDARHLVIGSLSEKTSSLMSSDNKTEIIQVEYGNSYACYQENKYCISENDERDLETLWYNIDIATVDQLIFVSESHANINDQIKNAVTINSDLHKLLTILQSLIRFGGNNFPNISVVTQRAQQIGLEGMEPSLDQSTLIGLIRVARNEYPEFSFRCIDTVESLESAVLATELQSDIVEHEIALRPDARYVLRMERTTGAQLEEASDKDAPLCEEYEFYKKENQFGLINLDTSDLSLNDKSQLLLKPIISTLNAKDIAWTDQNTKSEFNRSHYQLNHNLALCEPVIDSDTKKESLSKLLVLKKGLLPSKLTSEESDCITSDNMDAISSHNLNNILLSSLASEICSKHTRLKAGNTILIHAADTLFGQALVKEAIKNEAVVYATVTNIQNLENLLKMGVHAAYIGKNIKYTLAIKRDLLQLGKNGLDVLITCFSCEIAETSARLLSSHGRMIICGEQRASSRLEHSIEHIDLDRFVSENKADIKTTIKAYCDSIKDDKIQTEASAVFNINQLDEIPAVFAAEHPIDRITLEYSEPTRSDLFLSAKQKIRPNATYIVTGGFGGFGQNIARRLVELGAKHLVLVGRRGAATEEAKSLVAELESLGTQIYAPLVDVSNESQVIEMMSYIRENLPALKGIIHTAGILDDGPINFIEQGHFERVFAPKVLGAWNLHKNSLGFDLDLFVLFSSISGMIGAAGQASYVSANVTLDNFSLYRKSLGLPSTSISWGVLGEVGMAARDAEVDAYFNRVGLKPISPEKAISGFEQILDRKPAHVSMTDIDWGLWGSFYESWANSPQYAHLMPEIEEDSTNDNDWFGQWLTLPSNQQVDNLREKLISLVAKAMQLPIDNVGGDDTLPNLGIDSLIAMELQVNIQEALGIRVSTLELMKGSTLAQMSDQLSKKLLQTLDQESNDKQADIKSVETTSLIEQIDEDNLDNLLEDLMEA